MTLKERIENNVVIWLAGVAFSAFLAGIGVYKGLLEITQLDTVRHGTYVTQELHKSLQEKLEKLNGDYDSLKTKYSQVVHLKKQQYVKIERVVFLDEEDFICEQGHKPGHKGYLENFKRRYPKVFYYNPKKLDDFKIVFAIVVSGFQLNETGRVNISGKVVVYNPANKVVDSENPIIYEGTPIDAWRKELTEKLANKGILPDKFPKELQDKDVQDKMVFIQAMHQLEKGLWIVESNGQYEQMTKGRFELRILIKDEVNHTCHEKEEKIDIEISQ